jgi:hypothetical protein
MFFLYRILAEVLKDAASWVDRPWYNFNKGGKVVVNSVYLSKHCLTIFFGGFHFIIYTEKRFGPMNSFARGELSK